MHDNRYGAISRVGLHTCALHDAAKAKASLAAVGGNDGAADLARLWLLHARRKA